MRSGNKKGDSWPSDGHDHRDLTRESIYLNAKIERFLDSDRISLIIASKGMGKTLLIRVKHTVLTSESDGSLLIPSGTSTEKLQFDEPKIKSTLAQIGFGSLLLWKGIWSASILLSVLAHICARSDEPESRLNLLIDRIESLDIDDDFKNEYLRSVRKGEFYLPSHYLGIFLHRYTEKELQKFLRTSNAFDDLSVHYVTSQVIILIDAFDQALREAFPENVEAWQFGQLGLAKAAHSLFTTNHHIKVIATIRQEAWAALVDDDKEVIEGKAIILDYSARELKTLFTAAVQRYAGKSSVQEFLGVEKIQNTYCNEQEDPFAYIYRHSTGSPRALMHFGKALDDTQLFKLESDERAEEIRDQVDTIAAKSIFDDYLTSQKTPFLKTLTDLGRLRILLRLIPSNVLTASSLKSINDEFAKRIGLAPDLSHPFCELFNIGLLGRVQQNAASGGEFQYFRKPFEFDWNQKEILVEKAIYLLHPGLTSSICRERGMNLNRVNIIGIDRKWLSKGEHNGVPKIFLSHSSIDKLFLEKILPLLEHRLNLKFPSDFWLDKWKIRPGDDIHQKVELGVAGSDIVILFASANSLASGWVEKEWRTKHLEEISNGEIRVIVAIIDGTSPKKLPEFLKSKLAIVLSETDYEYSVGDLAESIGYHASTHLARLFPSGC
ncbi:toll/interleukin-1 receptor domain-containing protein [Thiocystis violascens]|uniref:TIR domain-containing protein n=1 Tax=Thiocystis violascens (strain ATCC 17096 / DSM 198 / 6111) TaxID=765911 RepID=I3Y8E1_THIV6|nr:toll/interleukin-1 receptor domain-containing protein [Thiocystis violascens]AFL73259.1 hypothetical protein Thivi_1236 [Thiocystis violascens DSM 198]